MNLYTNNLFREIFKQSGVCGNKVAIEETSGAAITYATLADQVNLMASNLVKNGFKKGDRALFLIRPGIRAIVLILAILRAGGVVVLADIAMGKDAFESRMALAEPQWMFVETILLVLQKSPFLRRIAKKRGVEIPELQKINNCHVVGAGFSFPWLGQSFNVSSLTRENRISGEELTLAPTDDMLIVFTSGTTALPKGVVHSQVSLEATVRLITGTLKPQISDIFYATSLHMIVPALIAGARVVIPRGRFSAKEAINNITRYRATKTFGTPEEFTKITDYCQATNRSLPDCLDTIMLGSAPISAPFLTRLTSILPDSTRVFCVYGMTEILPACQASLTEKINYNGKGNLVGKPLPGTTIALAPDGELIVNGPHLFSRYLSGQKSERHYSGDIARIDGEGNVILLGRKKDMIIRKNYNIYPTIFESTILKIPGVRNCSMVGRYNEIISDEEVILVVEKEDDRDEVLFRKFLQKELLTGAHSIDMYAQPDRIIFMTVPTGGRSQKTDKNKLREMVK